VRLAYQHGLLSTDTPTADPGTGTDARPDPSTTAASEVLSDRCSPAAGRKCTPVISSGSRNRSGRPQKVVATRLSELPIVAAGSVPGYGPIFNAGVIRHDGYFHLFARAVRDGYRHNPASGCERSPKVGARDRRKREHVG
jgi:hypothetical protein